MKGEYIAPAIVTGAIKNKYATASEIFRGIAGSGAAEDRQTAI